MILPKFIVRRSHGRQYIPDLDAVCLTEKFRGRPELTEPSDDEQRAALTRAAAICPTQAIAAELNATGNVNFHFGRYGVEFTASPRHADGIVLTGPVTANMAEALDICYNAVAEPKLLIVCGSEACSGGLYAASRAVDRSFFERQHVDLWLPGAPTHPMTFIDGIRTLLRKKQR